MYKSTVWLVQGGKKKLRATFKNNRKGNHSAFISLFDDMFKNLVMLSQYLSNIFTLIMQLAHDMVFFFQALQQHNTSFMKTLLLKTDA